MRRPKDLQWGRILLALRTAVQLRLKYIRMPSERLIKCATRLANSYYVLTCSDPFETNKHKMQGLLRSSRKCASYVPSLEALMVANAAHYQATHKLCEPSTSGREVTDFRFHRRKHYAIETLFENSGTRVNTENWRSWSDCSPHRRSHGNLWPANCTGLNSLLQQQRLLHSERGGGRNTFLSVSNKDAVEYQRIGQIPEGPFEDPKKQVMYSGTYVTCHERVKTLLICLFFSLLEKSSARTYNFLETDLDAVAEVCIVTM